ncbi:hypothetical protein RGU70_03920 [Herbaspirillum sp. RTI4]|uniref:hypothetical protein n=1 Tax=Herbaspirillum sp. RTI4 TaxID=3048640 RepID=UPI002AB55A0D|nr:hypothetical protein [Herbaspirillum sp. RTI4]MDY7577466.1 hypothetical protein [Herbaspirillum sp. RTI4]MEA9981742.1 hypothetical protein [Herbaspirillum sp. RTI4]
MSNYKIVSALLIAGVLASSVSTAAYADGRGHGGGNGVALVAGILGAVAVGSIIANSGPVYQEAPRYYPPQRVYQEPQPVYYQAPQQVYYQQPGYYQRPVVYVEPEHRRHHGYYEDSYYGRRHGYDDDRRDR